MLKKIITILTRLREIFVPIRIQKMFNPCQEITKRLSKMDELRFYQKLEVYMHLFLCVRCYNYTLQLASVSRFLKKIRMKFIQNRADYFDKRIQLLNQKVISQETKR